VIGQDAGWASRFRQAIPRREILAAHPWLRPVAGRLLDPQLWRLQHESVARGVAVGIFWAFVLPVAQNPGGSSPLHMVARQHTGCGCDDDGHQSADDRFLALAGIPDGCDGIGSRFRSTCAHGCGNHDLVRRVWLADGHGHGHVRCERLDTGLPGCQADLAFACVAQAPRKTLSHLTLGLFFTAAFKRRAQDSQLMPQSAPR
jgi:hypothetical protein